MPAYGRQGLSTSRSTQQCDSSQYADGPFCVNSVRRQRSSGAATRVSQPIPRATTKVSGPRLDEPKEAIKVTLQGLEESFPQPVSLVDNVAQAALDAEPSPAKRRKASRARQQLTYKVAAISASLGITALAIAAVHYRYAWQRESSGPVPVTEAVCTILLVFGGVVGMEMWARWAHKALWHDFAPGWALHKSHHAPRLGPFEANDVFAIVNAVPAIGLCAYGFLTPTTIGGICFGAGLGITLFGMMYMFVHDGLVHKRFPVGPLADVPYLKRVAAAHKLHHAEKFEGVPWGLFLGPQELEAVGGHKELEYMCRRMEDAKEREMKKMLE